MGVISMTMSEPLKMLKDTLIYNKFEREFFFTPGTHILGLGQTGTGKTRYKGIAINRWLMEKAGETLYIVDCGKPGEILPYANFGKPLNLIIPMNCDVEITGSPVPIHKNYAASPEENWDYVKKDEINIFTFRWHTIDPIVKGEYMARFMEVVINQVMRGIMKIPLPGVLDIDECQDVIGAKNTWEDEPTQKKTAARSSAVIQKVRFVGLRIHARTQDWNTVYAIARRQFPFLCLSRSPSTKGARDNGKVGEYSFDTLRRSEAVIVFPERQWRGIWRIFKFLPDPEGMTIQYQGEVRLERSPVRKAKRFVGETPVQEIIKTAGDLVGVKDES